MKTGILPYSILSMLYISYTITTLFLSVVQARGAGGGGGGGGGKGGSSFGGKTSSQSGGELKPADPIVFAVSVYGSSTLIALCIMRCFYVYIKRNCRNKIDLEPYLALSMAQVHNKNPELIKFEFAKIGVGSFTKNIFWWQSRIWEISKTP